LPQEFAGINNANNVSWRAVPEAGFGISISLEGGRRTQGFDQLADGQHAWRPKSVKDARSVWRTIGRQKVLPQRQNAAHLRLDGLLTLGPHHRNGLGS
jgi:hypothetical protein